MGCCLEVDKLFIHFILIHFSLINTCFRWHLCWQVFGLQPGTRDGASGGAFRQLQGTVCENNPCLLPPGRFRSLEKISQPLLELQLLQPLLSPSPGSMESSPQVPREELDENNHPSFVVGEAALLSHLLQGITHLVYLPPSFNSSKLDWRMGLQEPHIC